MEEHKCKRCGRVLKSENSIKERYGSLCLKKYKLERLKGYFKSSDLVLNKLREVVEK